MTTTSGTNYGVKEIAELFPSLLKIGDTGLREKVAAVWNEADHHRLWRKRLDL